MSIADSRAWRPLFAISKTLACWLHVRNFTGPIRNCTCMRSCASPPICWCACYGGARVATLDLPVALSLPDDEAVALLNEVFGDPEQRRALLSGEPVSVEPGGRFVSTAAATAT